MNYVWSNESRQAFLDESHRGRYLKSDIMINPPQSRVPLYAIQYVASNNQAIYKTQIDSLVLLAATESFFLVKTSDLERIGGDWPSKGKKPARGPEPEKRLDTAGYVWDRHKDTVKADAMIPHRVRAVEDLYHRIVNRCNPTDLPSTFDAGELRTLIPRPEAPEAGLPLGVSNGDQSFKSAYAASRRGEYRRKKARTESKYEDSDEGQA